MISYRRIDKINKETIEIWSILVKGYYLNNGILGFKKFKDKDDIYTGYTNKKKIVQNELI